MKSYSSKALIKNLQSVPLDELERYGIWPLVDDFLKKNPLDIQTQSAQKKEHTTHYARLLVGAYLYLGLHPKDSLKALSMLEKGMPVKAINEQFFPLGKTSPLVQNVVDFAAAKRSKTSIKRHDTFFGKNNDMIILPLVPNSQTTTLNEEVNDFLEWYNAKINQGLPLHWSPDAPNKTYRLKEQDGLQKRQGGPRLMKLLRSHDWYLFEVIEALGGIGRKGLFEMDSTALTSEFKDNAHDISLPEITKTAYRHGLYEKFRNSLTQDYNLASCQDFDQYRIIITRNPYHIASMSTGQMWESCMQLYDFCLRPDMSQEALNHAHNDCEVFKDIEYGSLIAYLVHKDDQECRYPLMRRAMRVGIADKNKNPKRQKFALITDNHYGLGLGSKLSFAFLETIRNFLDETYHNDLHGHYSLVEGLYSDQVEDILIGSGYFGLDNLHEPEDSYDFDDLEEMIKVPFLKRLAPKARAELPSCQSLSDEQIATMFLKKLTLMDGQRLNRELRKSQIKSFEEYINIVLPEFEKQADAFFQETNKSPVVPFPYKVSNTIQSFCELAEINSDDYVALLNYSNNSRDVAFYFVKKLIDQYGDLETLSKKMGADQFKIISDLVEADINNYSLYSVYSHLRQEEDLKPEDAEMMNFLSNNLPEHLKNYDAICEVCIDTFRDIFKSGKSISAGYLINEAINTLGSLHETIRSYNEAPRETHARFYNEAHNAMSAQRLDTHKLKLY